MADPQNPGGNGVTPSTVKLKTKTDTALTAMGEGMGPAKFEPPLERLVRLHKEDPKRARILGAKIRQAVPSLSTKPLSAQDKIRARQ